MNPISKHFILFIIVTWFVACGKKQSPILQPEREVPEVSEKNEKTYVNPVFEPILADPSVIWDWESGYFYAYGTEDNWGDGKGTRFMPILKSRDLVDWTIVGDAFKNKPKWKNSGFLWAADINRIDEVYFLYYSYSLWGDSNPGIGLAISSTPSGPFIDQGKLFTSNEINVPNSIDPFYWEEGNKKYLFWGSFSATATQGTYGVELTADGKSVSDLTKKFKIAAGDFEAVMIHKREGYYYFFGSKGSCCLGANSTYNVRIARSKLLTGPYLDRNGKDVSIRGNGSLFIQGNEKYAGPGHNAQIVTDDEGSDWFLYHAIDKAQGTVSGGASRRVLMLDKVIWKNGWPSIEGNAPSTTTKEAPFFIKR